jgi:hypothetical protein
MEQMAEVVLEPGVQLLTLTIVKGGNMNFDYLEFTKAKAAPKR